MNKLAAGGQRTMTFASKDFILYFLPIFLIAYFSFRGVRVKNLIFLVFSLLFYSSSEPVFLVLLLASITANFFLALSIDLSGNGRRSVLLAGGIAANILLLVIFKYTGFFVENINTLLSPTRLQIPVPHLTLPLGISFYTFHAISYLVDVAKRKVSANRRFDEFMLYMSMFPQLVAGPIVRYSTVAKQLHDRRVTLGRFSAGMRIFVIGLSWKLLIADQLAPLANAVFDSSHPLSLSQAWLGLYAYSMQIYFDFGGYSAMAVGLGVMTGFVLPRNFRIPYGALSLTTFWRRWHMSLSAWLRDYVYIPLGGNRGTRLRTYGNLWTVFLLCGLWHGAGWNFIIWGAYHGLFLVIERAGLGAFLSRLPREIAHIYAVLVVFFGWVWFRAADLHAANRVFSGLFGLNGVGDLQSLTFLLSPVTIAVLIVAGLLAFWKWPRFRWPKPRSVAVMDMTFVAVLLVLSAIAAASADFSPFLYDRF
jgi:D-alanyl-lipoteichoic acid acyltransferase DltB (MBOAT superfamily)